MGLSKQPSPRRFLSEKEVYDMMLEGVNIGMQVRQGQLNCTEDRSGHEALDEWWEENRIKNKVATS